MADEWLFVPFDRKDPAQRHWHRHPGVWRHVAPTRNENRFFAGCWVLAVAAALGVLAAYAHAMRSRAASAQDAAAMLLLSLGAYALATAVSLKALLMTRRIIWMILRRGLFGRPVLPRPGDERDLPRAASARLKHPAEPVSSPRRGGRT